MIMRTIAHAPILLAVATLEMISGANAFLNAAEYSSTGGILAQSIRPRATFGTTCASALQHLHGVPAIANDLRPQNARSSSRTERPNRRVESTLFAYRRRGFNKGSSSAKDDDDEYDDEYIDNLINEKFDDVDFDDDLDDDDDFIIDAEVEDRSTAGDEDDREYQYARVGRRRGRGAERYEEGRSAGAVSSSSSSSSRREQRRSRRGSYADDVDEYDGYDAEFDEGDDDYEEDYEEDYDGDDKDEDEDEDFEEGILIPNPILDSVDPEGASERIGELFEDPKFWKDMAVVALVVWTVYYLTYDPTDLIPWDSVTPNDFNLEGLYQKR